MGDDFSMWEKAKLSRSWVLVDRQLQRLFCFELKRKRCAHQTLPQGWASSACMFYPKISNCLSNIPYVGYVDDVIVGGSDREEHDKNLELLLGRLKEMSLHISEKNVVCSRTALFSGHDIQEGRYSLDTHISE